MKSKSLLPLPWSPPRLPLAVVPPAVLPQLHPAHNSSSLGALGRTGGNGGGGAQQQARSPFPAGPQICFNPWAAQGGWQAGHRGVGSRVGPSGLGSWGGQGLLGSAPQAHTAFAPSQFSQPLAHPLGIRPASSPLFSRCLSKARLCGSWTPTPPLIYILLKVYCFPVPLHHILILL